MEKLGIFDFSQENHRKAGLIVIAGVAIGGMLAANDEIGAATMVSVIHAGLAEYFLAKQEQINITRDHQPTSDLE